MVVCLARGETHEFALRGASAAPQPTPVHILVEEAMSGGAVDVPLRFESVTADANAEDELAQLDANIDIEDMFETDENDAEVSIRHTFVAVSGTEPPLLDEPPPGWELTEALNELVLRHGPGYPYLR
jgi:hypothetical protein